MKAKHGEDEPRRSLHIHERQYMAAARLSHVERKVKIGGERERRAEERMHDLELHHLSQVREW